MRTPEEILKSLPEEERTALESHLSKAKTPPDPMAGLPADVRKRLADNEIEIAKLRDERELDAIRSEVTKSMGNLPHVEGVDVAITLQKARKAGIGDEVTKLLSAASVKAAASSKLEKALGTNLSSDSAGAHAKLDRIAADIRKANPKLTQAQAVAEALKQNPDLYTEVTGG
jgi:hypothetical protein